MSDVHSPSAMLVRLSKYLPRDLDRAVSRNLIANCCQTAWDNGWRDPEWLANTALLGTGMDNVTNAAALFTAQLRDAANTECPLESTPVPPPVRMADPFRDKPPADVDSPTKTRALDEMRHAIDDARRKPDATSDEGEAA